MGSLATTTGFDDASRSPLFPRVGDDELGQRIAMALRERRPTLDMEPLFAGRYKLEGLVSKDARLERHDAIRVADGRWVTIEMPVDADPQAREGFIRCARQQCRLRHPHAMYALEHGVGSDGVPYLVREALDTESLAQMLAREGSVTWTRARSIALQICNVVSAARELGLAPTDLSLEGCRRARHGRAVDDIRLVEWRELETLTPDERDERAAVFAIARIIEELVAGYGPHGEVGTNPHVVAPPPAELGDVLARGRSLVPSARYATVEQLGLAIASIGDLGPRRPTPTHDDTMYALHLPPRRRSRPIEQPAEIQCMTAAVFVEPTKPSAQPTVDAAAPTSVQRRGAKWPWYMLGTMVAACAVHVLVPTFWPGVAAQAQGGVEMLRDAVQGREPLEAPPAAAEETSEPEPPAPLVVEAPPPPAPVVAPPVVAPPVVIDESARSLAVPPAPVMAAVIEPIARPRPKAKKIARPKVVTVEHVEPIAPATTEEVAADAVAEPETPAIVTASASAEIPEPLTTKLPAPPTDDPPIDVPATEGETAQ